MVVTCPANITVLLYIFGNVRFLGRSMVCKHPFRLKSVLAVVLHWFVCHDSQRNDHRSCGISKACNAETIQKIINVSECSFCFTKCSTSLWRRSHRFITRSPREKWAAPGFLWVCCLSGSVMFSKWLFVPKREEMVSFCVCIVLFYTSMFSRTSQIHVRQQLCFLT